MLPNWEDDPAYVFAMIKNYLDADPGSNPRDLSLRQKREREEAVREAIDGLKGSRRLLLRYTLKQAQKYIAMREFMKAILVKGITQFKRVYHILSRRLAGRWDNQGPGGYFLPDQAGDKSPGHRGR